MANRAKTAERSTQLDDAELSTSPSSQEMAVGETLPPEQASLAPSSLVAAPTDQASLNQSTPKRVRGKRGRPPKLDWLTERKIATFIKTRGLEGRLTKNAVRDAIDVLEREHQIKLSRATIYRILEQHGHGAEFTARVLSTLRQKRFARVIDTKKRFRPPNFSDWSPDEK
jgi:hypothetical protein